MHIPRWLHHRYRVGCSLRLFLCQVAEKTVHMLCSFFQLALGLDISNSSILTLIPYLAMIAATPFVGALTAQHNELVVPPTTVHARS